MVDPRIAHATAVHPKITMIAAILFNMVACAPSLSAAPPTYHVELAVSSTLYHKAQNPKPLSANRQCPNGTSFPDHRDQRYRAVSSRARNAELRTTWCQICRQLLWRPELVLGAPGIDRGLDRRLDRPAQSLSRCFESPHPACRRFRSLLRGCHKR